MIGDTPQSDPRSKAAAFFANVTGLTPIPVVCGHLDERLQVLGLLQMTAVRPDRRMEDTAHPLTIQMRFSAIDWL